MKTALFGGAPSGETCVQLAGKGTNFQEIKMPGNGDTQTDVRQPILFVDEATDLDFACDLVELFGAKSLLSVARYSKDGQSHVEVFGPLPRGWRSMISARTRRQGTPRVGWRNSRGWRLHPVTFSQLGELAAELAEQRAARRAI